MQRLHRTIALALIAVSPMAHAQLYGTSPFQNGPAPENGSLYVFDPDTLTWIDGQEVSLPGFFITGITGLTVHPTLAPPNDWATPSPRCHSGKTANCLVSPTMVRRFRSPCF